MKTKKKPDKTIKMKLSQLEPLLKEFNLPIPEELQNAINRDDSHSATLEFFGTKDGGGSMRVSFLVPTQKPTDFKQAM